MITKKLANFTIFTFVLYITGKVGNSTKLVFFYFYTTGVKSLIHFDTDWERYVAINKEKGHIDGKPHEH